MWFDQELTNPIGDFHDLNLQQEKLGAIAIPVLEQNEHVNLLMSGPLFNKNRNSQNYSGNGNASESSDAFSVSFTHDMVQNYWTHDRRFGKRRYPNEHDNAMNLGEWLSVTASFSASLQNNHFPHFLRTSHDSTEYDFGFLTVRAMKSMRLVKASSSGAQKPEGIALQEVGF